MRARDLEYVDNRLIAPAPDVLDAMDRLRRGQHEDLVERLQQALQVFTDECRAVRTEMLRRARRGMV